MRNLRRMPVNLGETREYSTAPEFANVEGVYRQFGLRQSILYRLLAEGKIRAVSIRQPGRSRGKRLFDCNSIRAFLNQNVDVDPELDQ